MSSNNRKEDPTVSSVRTELQLRILSMEFASTLLVLISLAGVVVGLSILFDQADLLAQLGIDQDSVPTNINLIIQVWRDIGMSDKEGGAALAVISIIPYVAQIYLADEIKKNKQKLKSKF